MISFLLQTAPDDEILQEIKKCQQELATVNEYNVEELKRLKSIVTREIKAQEIKTALDKVDNQVCEYSQVLRILIENFSCWNCIIKFC